MSLPAADWPEQLECGQLSPTSILSLRHHSTEDILAEALEKVRILKQLQTQRHGNLNFDRTLPEKMEGGFGYSQSSNSSGGSGEHVDTGSANRSNQWRKSKGTEGGSGGDEDEDDEDKTPTPSHSRRDTSPAHKPGLSQQPSYLQPPYLTPLSTKNNRYFLHPDVMHQQFSSEVSVLPVPHIMCPGGRAGSDALSYAAMLGEDCTVDENVFLADMIALKYLGLSERNHGSQTEARQALGYAGGIYDVSPPCLAAMQVVMALVCFLGKFL